jgi:alpha-mannosidase
VRIDWQGNPRIGEFEETDGWRNRRRPAYDDRFKLLVLFPARLDDQKVAKNAPYDVCESQLHSTSFNTWEDLKHNVILDWVDVTDGSGDYGLALFSDHTASYTHGPDFPLGLTLQYVGKGLWARDYRIEGPTQVRYALMPHAGRWDTARVSTAAASWQEPVMGAFSRGSGDAQRSLIDPGESGWEIPAMFERDGSLFVRLFNAHGGDTPHDLAVGFEAAKIELVELDGRVVDELAPMINEWGQHTVRLRIPRFGIRTLRFSDIKTSRSN